MAIEMLPNTEYLVKVYTKCMGQTGLNVRPMKTTTAVDAGFTLADFANSMASALNPLYLNLLCEAATFRGVTVQQYTVAGPPPVASGLDDDPGTRTGDPLPRQCCGMITLTTNFIGRDGRGRIFVPFPGEIDNTTTSGTPQASYVSDLNTLGSFFSTPQTLLDLASKEAEFIWTIKPAPMTFGGPFREITGRNGRQRWATQKSRGSYGAANTDPWD